MDKKLRWAVAAALLLGSLEARGELPVLSIGDGIRVDGYISVEYERQLEKAKEGRGDANGSFDADLFDLVMNWSVNEDLRVAADLTWEHGPAIEEGRGNVAVEYAWFEYRVRDWLRFRAGKMFTPFGIYNEIHTAKPAFLTFKVPLSTNSTNKFGTPERLYPRWSMAVSALGNGTSALGDWDYQIAVANGENEAGTENPFEKDDNREKAVMGRVRLQVLPRLLVGGSFYTDRLTEYVENEDEELEATNGRTTLLTYGGQLTWSLEEPAVGLELEYVRSNRRPSSASGLASVDTNGASAMLWWTIAERYTPYARVEYLDPDTDASRDEAKLFLAGVNVKTPAGLVLKLELDTFSAGRENGYFSKGRNSYHELKAAAVLGF